MQGIHILQNMKIGNNGKENITFFEAIYLTLEKKAMENIRKIKDDGGLTN